MSKCPWGLPTKFFVVKVGGFFFFFLVGNLKGQGNNSSRNYVKYILKEPNVYEVCPTSRQSLNNQYLRSPGFVLTQLKNTYPKEANNTIAPIFSLKESSLSADRPVQKQRFNDGIPHCS